MKRPPRATLLVERFRYVCNPARKMIIDPPEPLTISG
jgi:hypothetical protein